MDATNLASSPARHPITLIEDIDAAGSESERQALIIKRTKEEDRFLVKEIYYVTAPDVFWGAENAGLEHFQEMVANLTWDFYHPKEGRKRPALDFRVLEFCHKETGLRLAGKLNLQGEIMAIGQHNAQNDRHKAINRTGCYDITICTTEVAYTNLREDPDEKLLQHEWVFKPGREFTVAWSPIKGTGRIIGTNISTNIPVGFIMNDGFPSSEVVKLCYDARTGIEIY